MRKLSVLLCLALLLDLIYPYGLIVGAETIKSSSIQEEQEENEVFDEEPESEAGTNADEVESDEDLTDTESQENEVGQNQPSTNEQHERKETIEEIDKEKKTNRDEENRYDEKNTTTEFAEDSLKAKENSSNISTFSLNAVEEKTSKLGHINSTRVKIYPDLNNMNNSFSAGTTYTHSVYYIKKEAKLNGELYYLISRAPSSVRKTVGWVKSTDMKAYAHTVVDKKSKQFYVSGSGSAYTDAWGGRKNYVYSSLSKYKGQTFDVHLTEKVGNDVWYRGKLDGETVWISDKYLTYNKPTKYNLTLKQALELQMKVGPQTDQKYAYVSKKFIKSNKVTADVLNVRGGAGTNNKVVGKLYKGNNVKILGELNGWYQIKYNHNQWVNAHPNDVLRYLDPKNFINDDKQLFQFLDLSKPSGATARELNNYLKGKGILSGQGQAFIDGGRQHGLNDVYLISHALLETGNGTSKLARGVKYKGKTVYNMFGIGAYDNCPIECGVEKAFNEGWTTPYKAIVGGAKFIGNGYIKTGQNTLYKMRWNPKSMDDSNRATHQYATDIGWASKQVNTLYNLYQELDSFKLTLDIPSYK